MTRHSWMERLTPFTGGMAMALLVVALVVQPAWAEDYNTCTRCLAYYELRCDKLNDVPIVGSDPPANWPPCGPKPSGQAAYYAWRDCMERCKAHHCVGEDKSCPGKNAPNTNADCGSPGCNFYDGVEGVSAGLPHYRCGDSLQNL